CDRRQPRAGLVPGGRCGLARDAARPLHDRGRDPRAAVPPQQDGARAGARRAAARVRRVDAHPPVDALARADRTGAHEPVLRCLEPARDLAALPSSPRGRAACTPLRSARVRGDRRPRARDDRGEQARLRRRGSDRRRCRVRGARRAAGRRATPVHGAGARDLCVHRPRPRQHRRGGERARPPAWRAERRLRRCDERRGEPRAACLRAHGRAMVAADPRRRGCSHRRGGRAVRTHPDRACGCGRAPRGALRLVARQRLARSRRDRRARGCALDRGRARAPGARAAGLAALRTARGCRTPPGAVRLRHPLVREALLSAAAAASVAALLVWLGPPGTDFAAHAYQRTVFLEHGFTLWNNFWYAGRYSFVTYSLVYYPLAALLGIRLLAVATIVLAALAFAVVLWREWGAETRWSSRTFAVVWAGIVLSAAFPFALGISIALLAIWALQAGKRWRFAALGGLTLAASPLAFLLLVFVLGGVAIARRDTLWRNWVAVAGVTVAALVES